MMIEVLKKTVSGELQLIVPEGHSSQLTIKQVFEQQISSTNEDNLIFPVIDFN
jgi:hypothetical protein